MISFEKKINLKRTMVGTYKGGFYEKGSIENLTLMATVQPHFFREVDKLPEGRQVSDAIKIYTEEKLISKNGKYQSDIVNYKGLFYEVFQVKDYSDNDILPHFKCIALLVNEENQEGVSE